MTLAFTHPQLLWLLLLGLLPLLPRQRAATTVSSLQPLRRLPPTWRIRLLRLQPALAALTLALLSLLLAGPVQRETTETTVREGVDLMLAFDVSASMGANDIPPNRMVAARTAAADFLTARRDDRVGVILFSGVAVLLSPPVLDKGPLIARLRTIEADRSGSGTAIGDALAAALARLKNSPARSKAIVLLTDGTSNRGRITPTAATRAAAALGIRVYTIGFGSEAGGEIPMGPDGALARQADGTLLRSAIEEAPLREMARITGGQYFRAADGDTLRTIYRRIDSLEKSPLETRETIHDRPLTPLLQPLVILLLALELLFFRLWLRCAPTGYGFDLIALLALLLLCIPLAHEPRTAPRDETGPALALAIDVSTSMAATDVEPSRLAQAQQELRTLVNELPNARFSLTLFSGEGVIQSPLTEDRDALLFFIEHLTPGMIAAPGSAPEEGVLTAVQTLPASGERAVILLSDGERTVPDAPPRLLTEIPVLVVALGTAAGSPVLDANSVPRSTRNGAPLITRLDQERLRQIAAATHGELLLRRLETPATMTLVERWRPTQPPHTPRFWWLWLALALLALRQWPFSRKRRRWRLLIPATALLGSFLAACGGSSASGERAFGEGLSAAQSGAHREAAAAFSRAASAMSGAERGAALYNQGTELLEADATDQAVPVLEQALLLLPSDPAIRTNLALALRNLGDRVPSGAGDGDSNHDESGDAPMSREQARQLVDAIKPQAFSQAMSSDQVQEQVVESDW